eukprot:gene7243-9875_t
MDTTYWRRVTFGDSIPPWELRFVEGQGYAAFATRRFIKGELICKEFPMVWIHGHHPFSKEQVEEINKKVNKLDEDDRKAFSSLANMFENDLEIDKFEGIFMTNCFDMTESIYGETCAMYVALARLNHSCTPNAQQTHHPDTSEEVLYAVRDIEIGEEINDCYIDLRAKRDDRRAQLMEYYRFQCNCQGCCFSHFPSTDTEVEIEKDDRIRQKTSDFLDSMIALIENGNEFEALQLSIVFVKELEKPIPIMWSVRYLPEMYMSIYQIAISVQENKIANEYLNKAWQLNVLLQGENSPDSKRTNALLITTKNNKIS